MATANRTRAISAHRTLERIEQLQEVQRRNAPTSAAWQRASRDLAPLFAAMARRTGGAS